MNWTEEFQNPSSRYRPIPFLALNDALEEDELKWQIREMKKAGLGGFFLHARSGLVTEYMSGQWMELTRACVETAKELGMETWLYDEDGYPSGFAAGAIPAIGVAYHKKWLVREYGSHICRTEQTVGCYLIQEEKGTFQKILPGEERKAAPGEICLHIYWDHDPYYVDVLDKKVIGAFITETHEKYRERFEEEFGKGIKGIFTDEPQYSGPTIPWSLVLSEEFKKEHGYELTEKLPLLFYEMEGYEKVRYDYWRTVNRLFTEGYSGQIGEWCKQNHLIHTGHINCEEELHERMRNDGGAMTFYQYMQMPGVDWLARRIGTPVTVKQASSVAHQLGKERVICETYGGCGWSVSFEELKWISEWLYVLGVNATCQHLQLYSLRGVRKNDYPPSLYYQQPWWEEYRIFNDHFARLSWLLTQGQHQAEVLLIHPMGDAWIRYQYDRPDHGMGDMDEKLESISRWLLEHNIDFDYGDEELLRKYGSVLAGRLVVGACAYPIVVLPDCSCVDEKTAELLLAFAQNGGSIIAAGSLPAYYSGVKCGGIAVKLEEWAKQVSFEEACVMEEIEKHLSQKLSIEDMQGSICKDIYSQRRSLNDGGELLFLVNTSNTLSYRAKITVDARGLCRCDLDTGEITAYPAEEAHGELCFYADFAPMQSHMFLLTERENQGLKEKPKEVAARVENCILEGHWRMELLDENAYVMDYASLSVNNGPWSQPLPIYKIYQILLEKSEPVKASIRYEADIRLPRSAMQKICLGIETPGQYRIRINGMPVEEPPVGWWRDKCIQKIPVGRYLKSGKNEICLEVDFACSDEIYRLMKEGELHSTVFNKLTMDMELCNLILLGHFGVYSEGEYQTGERTAVFTEGSFYIGPLKENVAAGDLTRQGLCFYAGNVLLSKKIIFDRVPDRAVLHTKERMHGVLYKVLVNGKECGVCPWAPFDTELAACLRAGENELGILVYGSCRNLFGPHHHILGEPVEVGPSSFTDQKGWVERHLPEEHIWTDRYCFVEFGLGESIYLEISEDKQG